MEINKNAPEGAFFKIANTVPIEQINQLREELIARLKADGVNV